MAGAAIVDARNLLDRVHASRAGFEYQGIGRVTDADRRRRRCRVHRLAPERRAARPGRRGRGRRQLRHRPRGEHRAPGRTTTGSSFVEHDVSDPLPVDGTVDAVLDLASPASPDDFETIPLEILAVGSHGHAQPARPRRGQAGPVPPGLDQRGLRRPAGAPPTRVLLGQRQPDRPAELLRRGQAVRRGASRWRTTARHGVDIRIVRIFNTYGPRMRPDDGRVVTNFIVQALRGEPLTVYGDGEQTRSFCYVSDEVAGLPACSTGPITRPGQRRQSGRVHDARTGRDRGGARRFDHDRS